mgnify:FL=1
MLETKRKLVIPVERERFLVYYFGEKCVKTHLQFSCRIAESSDCSSNLGIDFFEFGDDVMTEEISRDCCIIICLIMTKWDFMFLSVLEYLLFCDGDQRAKIITRIFLYAYKAGDTGSFCHPVDERLCLIVCMMGSHYDV